MISEDELTTEQEIATANVKKPHVVVLGAGASRAACPDGDINGKKLPLMRDFVDVLGMKSLLENWGIDPSQNFEEIFSTLHKNNESEKLKQIKKIVESYFDNLKLPDTPTLYDHLVLSLRSKDLIATFNWDPLLLQAYRRNRRSKLELPKLAFLHGNVRTGYCKRDSRRGLSWQRCEICGDKYKRTPLLYPTTEKEYAKDPFIHDSWNRLKIGFKHAFMITIFGYGAPKTDTEAKNAMQDAWGGKNNRRLEQITFISTQGKDKVCDNWKSFIHSHHFHICDDFYKSDLGIHPRRTGEAYRNQDLEANWLESNPIPRDLGFPEMWKWFSRFKKAEDESKKEKDGEQ